MALYMLSTDIAVCLIRGGSRALDQRVASALPEELCISAVTRGELLLGVARETPLATRAKAQAVAPPIDPARMESLRQITHAVLANLTPSEAKVLRARFGFALVEPTGSGDRAPDLSRVVDQFLARVSCLPWDSNAATQFATLAVELHRVGAPMGTTDSMVAGHAVAVGAVLVIGTESRLPRVEGLKTENWTQPVRKRLRQ